MESWVLLLAAVFSPFAFLTWAVHDFVATMNARGGVSPQMSEGDSPVDGTPGSWQGEAR